MRFAKLILGLLILISIFFNLKSKITPEIWELFLKSINSPHFEFIAFAFLLMPINWLLETSKFYLLMNKNHPVRYATCIKAIFAGVSVAIFTPNRIGEYAGRLLLFSRSHRKISVWSTIIGNYAQIISIVSVGIIGFYFFTTSQGLIEPLQPNYFIAINLVIILFLLVILIRPYQILKRIFKLIPVKSWRQFITDSLEPIKNFSPLTLLIVLLLSALRYGVFATQFYLTLSFFNVKLKLDETVQAISSVYLLKTTIPYPPAFGFLMRGEISAWVFQFFTKNLIAVVAASMLIWIINVVLPAIMGYLILLRENWLKK